MVNQVECGPATNSPNCGDFPVFLFIGKVAPDSRAIGNKFLEAFFFITVDSYDGERTSFQLLHERPLVWKHCLTRASPNPPEIQQDNLASVFAELKFFAFLVGAYDVRSGASDA